MKKAVGIFLSVLVVTSAGSAALIPSNITVDLNVNFDGIFNFEQKGAEQAQQENNTYGERVNGQSVYTETRKNDPEPKRNNDELDIRDDSTEAKDPIKELLGGLFE